MAFTYEIEDRVVVIKKAAEKPNSVPVEQKGITGIGKRQEPAIRFPESR